MSTNIEHILSKTESVQTLDSITKERFIYLFIFGWTSPRREGSHRLQPGHKEHNLGFLSTSLCDSAFRPTADFDMTPPPSFWFRLNIRAPFPLC
jgi:hypothetical protein